MIRIRQTVGIDKMGIFTPKLSSPLVHHIRKSADRSGYLDSHLGTDFVSRGQHNCIKTLLYGQLFAYLGINSGITWRQVRENDISKGDFFIDIRNVFQD